MSARTAAMTRCAKLVKVNVFYYVSARSGRLQQRMLRNSSWPMLNDSKRTCRRVGESARHTAAVSMQALLTACTRIT
jgi:hypothetical protein